MIPRVASVDEEILAAVAAEQPAMHALLAELDAGAPLVTGLARASERLPAPAIRVDGDDRRAHV